MDLSRATVAVTGATGFIGRYLVRALADRGARVVAVVRNPHKVPTLAERAEIRVADLTDRAALASALRGCDAVMANAGVVGLGGVPRDALIRANVEGTANVLRAMVAAGVGRVVMTSSAAAYRPRPDHLYDEEHPLYAATDRTSRFGWYAVSKGAAEREAWRLAGELGLALSTVRPHAIHGAFDPHGPTLWLRRLMTAPVGLWVRNMEFPSVYAGDVADAMVRMLERPVAHGRAYNVAGEGHGFWELYEAWREAGGPVPRLVVPVPVPLRRRFALTRVTTDLDWRNRPLVEGFRELLALESAGGL